MTNRLLSVCCLVVGLVCAQGCQSKGPVPGEGSPSEEAPKVGTSETTGAHPGAANPHAGVPGAPGSDPHAGLGIAPVNKGPSVTDNGFLDIGAIALKVPDHWIVEPPKSSMRKAQMRAPGSAGDAELVVFYFGDQGAGSAQENIERWVSQFTTADGKPVTEVDLKNVEVNDFKVSRVEVAGRFANNMPMQGQEVTPVENQRLVAAIVSSVSGPYYVKFLGPDATVTENRQAFDVMLQSIVPAP